MVEAADGRPNLVATAATGGDGPGLMFLGHSDVVPPGPGWTGDPFVPRRDGDRIIGRGSSDMKGGIAAVVAAMSVLARAADAGLPLSGPIRLVVTVDEEEHGVGVRHLVSHPEVLRARILTSRPTCIKSERRRTCISLDARRNLAVQLSFAAQMMMFYRTSSALRSSWSTLFTT